MAYVNLNSVLNRIADEQGVEPGSWEWLLGGVAAYSGQSGSHSSYGWNHTAKVNPDYVRGVVANYGHRRTYYQDAPVRQFGYAAGGRPKPWSPELPGDLPTGEATYFTSRGLVVVSGPEVEHFWLDPLWALMDSPAVDVTVLGGQLPSTLVAKVIATLQVRSLVGQIRSEPAKVHQVQFNDRANSRIVDTVFQAAKRGAIEQFDADSANDWIANVLLPHYEKPPGIGAFGKAPEGLFPVGCFNGLYWLLPVFYDAWKLTPDGSPLKDRFGALVARWSQWSLDLEETVPGRGFDMSRFYVDKQAFVDDPTVPLASIKSLLTTGNIQFDPDLTWEIWAYRACEVAAEVTGSPVLAAAATKLFAKHGAAPGNKVWMVGPDRDYAAG